MAAGARGAARKERERKREEGNRVMRGVEEENQARPATMTSRAFRREYRYDGGEGEGGRGRGTTWRRLAWDLCNLNFSEFRCSKLLDGGLQGLRIRRM